MRTPGARTIGAIAALLLVSCFGDSTAPGRLRRAPFAFAPVFDARALLVVQFDSVRIRLVPAGGGAAALDTTVAFPSTSDSVVLSLTVPVSGSAQTFSLTLAMINAAGDTVFRGGPVNVTALPGVISPTSTEVPTYYTGVGSNAAGVRFVGTQPSLAFFGDTVLFRAEAYDSAGHTIPGTPIVYGIDSRDTALARVINPDSGRVIAKPVRGPARVVAQLLTHQTATSTLTVQPRPSAISVRAGGGQTATVGTSLSTPLTVQVVGADGLGVQGVVVTFTVTAGGGSLAQSVDTTNASGDVTTTWTLGPTAGTQTVTASVGSVSSGAISATATAATVTRLAFTVQPGTVAAGASIAPAVQVAAQDAFGNTATGFTGNVTVALSANPGSATLSGTAAVAAVAGVATFSTLSLDKAASGYTLAAAASGLTGATSSAFAVTAGAATTLALLSGGGQFAAPGTALAQPVVVKVTDAFGNGVSGRAVTFAVATGGGSLGTTSTTTDATGAASTTWTLGAVGGTQSITATSTGLAGSPLTITAAAQTGAPAKLAFLVQPSNAIAGAAIAPAVQVVAQDSNGVTVPTYTGQVGVVLSTNPDTALLTGTLVVNAVAGVATFGNLSVLKADTGYALGAVSESLLPAFSSRFTITAGAAKALSPFSGYGQTGAQSTQLPQPVVVKVADSLGNGVSGVAVTFAVATGGGSVGTPNATTNASGLASTTWTLGATAGLQTITATAGTLVGSPLTISATAGSGIASTAVTPHAATLNALGQTVQLVAQSKDGGGNNVSGSFTWVSRTPANATVSAAGLVTAVANGTSYVVVTEAGGTKDSALITVAQTLASITVTPGNRSIYLTRSFSFTAQAVDGLGHALPSNPTFTWSTTAPAVATVDTAGHVTAVGLGVAQIKATSGGVIGVSNVSVITPITRIAVVVDTVGSVKTDTFTLTSLGLTRRYRAIAHDTLDAVMTGIAFSFQSTNGSVAQLVSSGSDTATVVSAANGVTSIQATAQGFTSNPGAQLNVSQVLASIELKPDTTNPTATIAVGGTVHVSARGKDANSRYIAGGSFKYLSATPTVATVDSVTGTVRGVALGTTNITATSGAITSNAVNVVVAQFNVPKIISFGRDTVSVGRGGNAQIPILLSTPDTLPLTVRLTAPAFAHWSAASVVVPAGQTAVNAQLNGDSAGTTIVTATDSSGLGYASASAVAKVTANMSLASGGYAINATDIVTTQVLLSDPSPAGGTYVTFNYSTPGVARVSPDPAFIPAGQLAADIQILAVGAGSTNITPNAIGVNGQYSSFTAYAPVLQFSYTSLTLGQGQYEPNNYVWIQGSTHTPIAVTLASSDSTVATVPSTVTIPSGSNYVSFNTNAVGIGTATITASATGWTASNATAVRATTPALSLYGGTTIYTTSPYRNLTVYTVDSIYRSGHYRINSLVVHLRSTDATVMQVVDTAVTIAPGQYYTSSGRVIPGGTGGTAYIVATASGHLPDSTQFTVLGPPLTISRGTAYLGAGQQDPNSYVYVPNSVSAPLVVTLTSSDSMIVGVPATVTIPAGSNYAYFTVVGNLPGSVTVSATATGFQAASASYAVTTPALYVYGSNTVNNYSTGSYLTVYATDSTGSGHYRTTPLVVSVATPDTNVVRLDSSSVTIAAGQYYNSQAHYTPVGLGTARIIFSAAGHRSLDTVTVTVVQPKVNFDFYSWVVGRRQHSWPTDFYVYTPNSRPVRVPVTITQAHATVDSLTTLAPVIDSLSNVAYFGMYGLSQGVDTLIATAAGYYPDTAFVTVTTPKFTTGGLPGSTTTTNPPINVYVYATDSLGSGHYLMDTVVVAAVSSDPNVIRPVQPYFRIPRDAYYAYATVNVVGPGTASITFSDSAGTGYQPVTTNTITVTGPSLSLANGSPMLGMRQHGGVNSSYVYAPNSVVAPLVVHLLSTGTRVATVPDSVIIPASSNIAYFDVTAQDTMGTIQIQASATGYGGAAMNVQVTVPRFVLSLNTQLYSTSSPSYVQVNATDANGNSHYTTENVTVTLKSSAPSVAWFDSSTVTILKDTYYNNSAHWMPGIVGTAQLSASDTTRAALYEYSTGTVNVSVVTPNLGFSWGTETLGIGQYIDNEYVYVSNSAVAPIAVSFSHTGTARIRTDSGGVTVTGVTIPHGTNVVYFRIVGTSAGTDTLVASATSPLHNPATAYTAVGLGTLTSPSGWPASLKAGDSTLVTLYTRDPSGNGRYVIAPTTVSLVPNAYIQFVSGGANSAVITSVVVPAGAYYVQFYLKGVSAGTGSADFSATNYQTYSPTVTITP